MPIRRKAHLEFKRDLVGWLHADQPHKLAHFDALLIVGIAVFRICRPSAGDVASDLDWRCRFATVDIVDRGQLWLTQIDFYLCVRRDRNLIVDSDFFDDFARSGSDCVAVTEESVSGFVAKYAAARVCFAIDRVLSDFDGLRSAQITFERLLRGYQCD